MADHWAICPWLNAPEMTQHAILDLLAQSLSGVRVLLIGQGASAEDSDRMREFAEMHHPRVLLWSWNPPLPSLSAVWNRALRFVWELGGEEALVCNNDQRCWRFTYEGLLQARHKHDALFVSAVGVKEAEFVSFCETNPQLWTDAPWDNKGGPDYSFFLLTRKGHEKYPFNENFRPAFLEDLCSHREYMLGGDGTRIFSVNIPYLHYASQTIKHYTPEQRQKFNKAYAASKEYYRALWGGDVNEERFVTPFGRDEPLHGAAYTATPDLQRRCLAGLHPYDDTLSAPRVSLASRSGEDVPSAEPS
jgi:hypothetical protein